MRLMNELHLYCPARRKHKHYCKYGDSAGTFEPNILQRQFSALQPLQKWTTDITEFKAFGKKLYLSVILDMYNGEIINYTLTESASLASVQQLISQAITILPQGTNLLFHSDRGGITNNIVLRTFLRIMVLNKACPEEVNATTMQLLKHSLQHLKMNSSTLRNLNR